MGGTPITVAPQSVDVTGANQGAADVLSSPQGTELLAPSTLPQFDPLAGRYQPREQMPTYNSDPLSMELQAAAVHHSRGANALDAISKAIVGDTAMRITPNPDGSYTAAPQETTPGQRWGRIAAIALAGAAKGFAAGQGPGGMGRAAGAGVDVGYQAQQNQQDNTMKLADQMNKQDRDRQLFNANMALMNQRLIAATFDNKTKPIIFSQEVQKNNLQNIETLRNMGATFAGDMNSLADMYSLGQNPDNVMAHTGQNGMFIPVQTFNGDGSMKGASGWILPEDKRKQLNTKTVTIPTMKPDPENPGKLIAGTPIVYEPGTATGEQVITAMHDELIRENQYTVSGWNAQTEARRAATEASLAPSEIGLRGAQAGAARAEGELHTKQAEMLDRTITGSPGGVPVEITDPEFPPQSNFPQGTMGIAERPKSGDYKIPADYQRAYRLSQLMSQNSALIQQTVRNNPQLLGKLQGLLSEGKTLVGLSGSKDDQALATLAGAMESYSAASAGYHTFRSMKMPEQTMESMLRHYRNAPEAVTAYLNSQAPAIQDAQRLMRNIEMYGTPDGPTPEARRAAVARAPNAALYAGALNQTGTGATATPTPNNNASGLTPGGAPPGATMQVPGSDGKMHWSDGKRDLGVVQ